MARPIKRLGPCRQGLPSISQEVEVISVPLNLVAYPGEIWLVFGSLSQHFVWLDYSPLDNAYGRPVSLHHGHTDNATAPSKIWAGLIRQQFETRGKPALTAAASPPAPPFAVPRAPSCAFAGAPFPGAWCARTSPTRPTTARRGRTESAPATIPIWQRCQHRKTSAATALHRYPRTTCPAPRRGQTAALAMPVRSALTTTLDFIQCLAAAQRRRFPPERPPRRLS